MYCPKCGKQLPNDARFCEFCGEGLESQSSVTNNENGTTWTNGTVKGRLTTTNKVNKTRYFRDENGVLKKKNVFITVGEVILLIALGAIMISVAVSIFSNGPDPTGEWSNGNELLTLNADNTFSIRNNSTDNVDTYGNTATGTWTKDGSRLTMTFLKEFSNSNPPEITDVTSLPQQTYYYRVTDTVAYGWRIVDDQLSLYGDRASYDSKSGAETTYTNLGESQREYIGKF